MAEGTGKVQPPEGERRAYGLRAVGAFLPAITRPTFRKRSPAAAQLLADWAGIVGPALAAETAPRRLTGGRLTIACAGPVAMELQHLAPELIARLNSWTGQATVTELRFVQDRVAESPAANEPRPPLPVSPKVAEAVDKSVAALPEGPLRDALASLGRSIHSFRPGRAGKISTPPGRSG